MQITLLLKKPIEQSKIQEAMKVAKREIIRQKDRGMDLGL